MAHKEIDLKNPKTNRKNAGFTDEERGKFSTLLGQGFIDTYRYFYPDQEGIYSWWSYRFQARKKNAGWRIDYFCVSESLKENWWMPRFTRKSWVLIIVRLSWILIFETEKECEYNARCIVKRDNLQFLIAMHLLL